MDPIREAEECSHCGSTEGRIEHGAYYDGKPICDACSEYVESNHAERPVDSRSARDLIDKAADLDELYFALKDIQLHCPDAEDLDYSDLPTFGGIDIADTDGIFSWDETRMLVSDATDSSWRICQRPTDDVFANYKAGTATRDEIIEHWASKGYYPGAVYPGEYVLLEDPNSFSYVRIYDDGRVWVKNSNTGEYQRWEES